MQPQYKPLQYKTFTIFYPHPSVFAIYLHSGLDSAILSKWFRVFTTLIKSLTAKSTKTRQTLLLTTEHWSFLDPAHHIKLNWCLLRQHCVCVCHYVFVIYFVQMSTTLLYHSVCIWVHISFLPLLAFTIKIFKLLTTTPVWPFGYNAPRQSQLACVLISMCGEVMFLKWSCYKNKYYLYSCISFDF